MFGFKGCILKYVLKLDFGENEWFEENKIKNYKFRGKWSLFWHSSFALDIE